MVDAASQSFVPVDIPDVIAMRGQIYASGCHSHRWSKVSLQPGSRAARDSRGCMPRLPDSFLGLMLAPYAKYQTPSVDSAPIPYRFACGKSTPRSLTQGRSRMLCCRTRPAMPVPCPRFLYSRACTTDRECMHQNKHAFATTACMLQLPDSSMRTGSPRTRSVSAACRPEPHAAT